MHRILIIVSLVVFTSCSKSDPERRCNFLLDVNVNATINLNLPQYSQLQFTGSTVYIPNQGNAGVYVSRTGNQFRAFDAADPNHQFNPECSFLENEGGIGTCGCEDANRYSLATGLPISENVACTMKEYRVESAGNNTLLITN